MYLIGVVSNSQVAIDSMISIAKEDFEEGTAKFAPFRYVELTDLQTIIESHQGLVDGWLFSGENPYSIALPYLAEGTPAVPCIMNGMEIYRYLLYCLYQSPTHELRISLDLPASTEAGWQTVITDLQLGPKPISFEHVHVHFFDHRKIDTEYPSIAAKHIELARSGEVDAIITSSMRVTNVLAETKDLSVPFYKTYGGHFTVRTAISKLKEQLMQRHLIGNQVASIRINVTRSDALYRTTSDTIQANLIDLKIKKYILELCQKIHSSYLTQRDLGRYDIFASRSTVESSLAAIHDTLLQIRLYTDIEMNAGVGFGSAMASSQRNAVQAFSYGREMQPVQLVTVIDDTGMIQENAGTAKELSYSLSTTDPVLLEKLETAGVSIKNYTKAAAIGRAFNRPFTSAELAQEMHVTERSARRILTKLLSVSLVHCVGEETLGLRGRPSKKYQF